jgi:hypothetical protein
MFESYRLGTAAALIEACWAEKISLTQSLLGTSPLRTLRPEIIGDRSRLDLQLRSGKIGMVSPQGHFSEVTQLDTPTPVILEMIAEIRKNPVPIEIASLRFRSSPHGIHGLWIEAANEDIATFLKESSWLESFVTEKNWIVEMGQKRKEAFLKPDHTWGLQPARGFEWLPSFDKDGQEIPLKSLVALFSQPGPEANRALLAAGFDLLDAAEIGERSWAEWGAGYGNLTAGYTSRLGTSGWASELDPVAFEWLQNNQRNFFPQIEVSQKKSGDTVSTEASNADLWILDPPRPGFGDLLLQLVGSTQKPSRILSYHCHSQGLRTDSSLLKDAGYQIEYWSSVDIFPATPHHEVVTLWRRQ